MFAEKLNKVIRFCQFWRLDIINKTKSSLTILFHVSILPVFFTVAWGI